MSEFFVPEEENEDPLEDSGDGETSRTPAPLLRLTPEGAQLNGIDFAFSHRVRHFKKPPDAWGKFRSM